LAPGDSTVARRARFVSEVLALDPTASRLSAAERYERSRELLRRIGEELDTCGRSVGTVRGLGDSVRVRLGRRVPAAGRDDAYQANLELADDLSREFETGRPKASTGSREVLDYVVARLRR
jgi:hypothetical protein